jgi:hypothetical protein
MTVRLGTALMGALLAAGVALGCSDTTAAQSKLMVEVKPGAVTAMRSSAGSSLWGSFTVDVTLRNATASTIRVYGCGPSLEREVGSGRWVSALEPVCSLFGPGYFELGPMSERSEQRKLTGALNDAGAPEFRDGIVAGRYRLLYRYAAAGAEGSFDEARSGAFEVTE